MTGGHGKKCIYKQKNINNQGGAKLLRTGRKGQEDGRQERRK